MVECHMLDKYMQKIKRRLLKARLRPIRVFLFHQVSDEFDNNTMFIGDWTQTEQFKRNIQALAERYEFISLDKAWKKIKKDVFRFRRYAVLTSDDGWASLNNILPWLNEKKIPITLFLNPAYFDGKHFRGKTTELYLLQKEVDSLRETFDNVTMGLHGWEHIRCTDQCEEEFRLDVCRCVDAMKDISGYVPFFAYTWGQYNEMTSKVLKENNLIPVLIDGDKNYGDFSRIHRELLDGANLI